MNELITARIGPVLELALNRPDRRNALSRTLIASLRSEFTAAAQDPELRVLIVTGAPPAFCAGLDLREVQASTPQQAEADSAALLELFQTLDGLRLPVIAAVNGPAVAGGAGLVSVCDIVVMSEEASIGYPEVKRGLIAAIVMTYLRRHIGERDAKYLLLTGESISAQRAVDLGLATEVCPTDQVLPRARQLADLLAALPPRAIETTKRLWAETREMSEESALRRAREVNAAMRTAQESRAGAAAFLGKTGDAEARG